MAVRKINFISRKTNDKAAKSPGLPIFLPLDTSAVKNKYRPCIPTSEIRSYFYHFDIVVPFSRKFDLIDCINFLIYLYLLHKILTEIRSLILKVFFSVGYF